MKNIITILSGVMLLLLFSCSKNQLAAQDPDMPEKPKNEIASLQAAGNGALDDSNIKYFGRWDFSSPTQFVSYWGGAYFKVNFSGTTVQLKVGNTSNFYAKIDNGPWVSFLNVGGTINLTPTALGSGNHTLSVAQGRDYDYVFNFKGLILDSGGVTSPPTVGTDLIEYIGDSITAGYTDAQANVSDYAWICSEALGTEHTQIAYPGVNLVNGYTGTGMETQYFKSQSIAYPSSPAWDFTKYSAKIVVINLGTNDGANNVPDATFQNTYSSFLANIRTKFPNAQIFVMRAFSGSKAAATSAAVTVRNNAGDTRVQYIDTNGWLVSGSSDYNPDNIHPSVSGQIKAANLLKPILMPYLTNGTQSIANGTYKIVSRSSGLVLDARGLGTSNGTEIQQYSYSGADNQRWTVSGLTNGYYKITGVASSRSLDVTGQSTADGTQIKLWDYNGGLNQSWILSPRGNGYYAIQAVHSNKLLTVAGNSTANEAIIEQRQNTAGDNQQWTFLAP